MVTALHRSFGPSASIWAHTPGTGAAGGCGVAALRLGARIVSGADNFLDLLDFDQHLRDVDLVMTGEGRLDRQTLAGKLPAIVAHRAAPTPVSAVVGQNDLTRPTPLFADIHAVADHSETDTANDPQRTASRLHQLGTHIGQRLINRAPTDRPVGENAALRTNMDLPACREPRHFSSAVLTFRRQTG